MDREKLLFMSNEQIKDSFLRKKVRVVLNDGQEEEFIVDKLKLTSYTNDESFSSVGFISEDGKSYLYTGIKEIFVVDNTVQQT
jgi:hypothetical protein